MRSIDDIAKDKVTAQRRILALMCANTANKTFAELVSMEKEMALARKALADVEREMLDFTHGSDNKKAPE